MPVNYCRTKRPREALLKLNIEDNLVTVENRWETSVTSGIPPFTKFESNLPWCIPWEDRVWWSVYLGQVPAKE